MLIVWALTVVAKTLWMFPAAALSVVTFAENRFAWVGTIKLLMVAKRLELIVWTFSVVMFAVVMLAVVMVRLG